MCVVYDRVCMYSARIDIYYFNKIIKRVGGRCNMPMSCSVPGCTSRKKLGSTIKFLGYPFKNPIQLKQWVNAVGRTNWQPSPSSKICSLHFQETDFILGLGYQNTQLKQDVVPSIFSHTSGIKKYVNYDKENLNQVLKPSDLNSQDLPSRKKFAKVPLTENVNILSPVTSKSADKLPNDYPDKENFTQDTITSFDKQKEETTVTDNTQETYMVFPLLSAENSSSSNISSPKTKALHKRIRTLSRSVKTLKQKIKRRDKKIRLMKDLFAQLKKKGLMDNDPLIIIKNQFEGMSLNIFKNELKNKNRRSSGRRYSDEIKEFALTLHYHSPKAYLFCR